MSLACVHVVILGLGLILLAADQPEKHTGPTKLPFSQGETFNNLDAYLAHLERLGPMGITWYELRSDGTYEMILRRMPGTSATILTRQELLERFGFAE
jgi:hypothetical protein